MVFWIALMAIGAGVTAVLCRPLVCRRPDDPGRLSYDLAVFRDQLDDIDRDLARGVVQPDEAEDARRDVDRRILAAARIAEAGQAGTAGRDPDAGCDPDAGRDPMAPAAGSLAGRLTAAGSVAAVVLAGSFLVYLTLGAPDQPGQPLADRLARMPAPDGGADGGTDAGAAPDFAVIIQRLRDRLADNPTDVTGWRFLGRSLAAVERFDEAADAYRRALSLPDADQPGLGADLAASLGETLYLASDGLVTSDAMAAFTAALERAPGDPRARYYHALGLAQRGALRDALDAWLALSNESPVDAAWQTLLRRDIAEAARQLGLDPDAVVPQRLRAGLMPDLDADAVAAAMQAAPDDRMAMIRDRVASLQARLADDPSDVDGWLQVIRSRVVLGEREAAAQALAEALAAHGAIPDRAAALNRLAADLGLAPAGATRRGPTAADVAAAATLTPEDRGAMIEGMVDRLEATLAAEPSDFAGWMMLIRSLNMLGQRDRAAAALLRARAAHGADPDRAAALDDVARMLDPAGD